MLSDKRSSSSLVTSEFPSGIACLFAAKMLIHSDFFVSASNESRNL